MYPGLGYMYPGPPDQPFKPPDNPDRCWKSPSDDYDMCFGVRSLGSLGSFPKVRWVYVPRTRVHLPWTATQRAHLQDTNH